MAFVIARLQPDSSELSTLLERAEDKRSVREVYRRPDRLSGMTDIRNSTEREWLGLRELTRYAAVSERTLRTWIRDPIDPLPAVRVARKTLVRRSEFDRWLERHRIKRLDLDGMVVAVVQEIAGRAR